MSRPFATSLLVVCTFPFIVACGSKKEEAATSASPTKAQEVGDVMCTYAPSQSAVVQHIAGSAGGAALMATAVAKAAGLTAVMHSSGAYIFTGSGGYIAGTLGSAAIVPTVVVFAVTAGGAAATLELLCVLRNHPDLVAKVEAAAQEFVARSNKTVLRTSKAVSDTSGTVVADMKRVIAKTTSEAFDYAYRKN